MTQVLAVLGVTIATIAFSFGYVAGLTKSQKEITQMRADVIATQKFHDAEMARAAVKNRQLEADLKKRKVKIETVTNEIVREIPVLVTGDLPDGWVRVHDAAVLSTAPQESFRAAGGVAAAQAAEVVVKNYGECHTWRDRLLGWQKWYGEVNGTTN